MNSITYLHMMHMSLVSGVTIRPLIKGYQIARKNVILGQGQCHALIDENGWLFFFEKHHLSPSLYNLREKVHPKHCVYCALLILLCFFLLDHAND